MFPLVSNPFVEGFITAVDDMRRQGRIDGSLQSRVANQVTNSFSIPLSDFFFSLFLLPSMLSSRSISYLRPSHYLHKHLFKCQRFVALLHQAAEACRRQCVVAYSLDFILLLVVFGSREGACVLSAVRNLIFLPLVRILHTYLALQSSTLLHYLELYQSL